MNTDQKAEQDAGSSVIESGDDTIAVSAVVSTYNSEQYFEGALEDLLSQTIHPRLEIVIIDSGSCEREGELARAAAARHPNIVYRRTEREPLYKAWNRAVEIARGKYLTICNTDDRHRRDALAVMASTLDQRKDVDLVYGDCRLTDIPNETFDQASARGLLEFRYPEYFGPSVLLHFQFGPQFMWRKSVGLLFDAEMKAAGDYDFNCRFNLEAKALHIRAFLGLYLVRNDAISKTGGTMQQETQWVKDRYRTVDTIMRLYARQGVSCLTPTARASVLVDMGIRAFSYYPPWGGGAQHCDAIFAADCFRLASEIDSQCAGAYLNMAVLALSTGEMKPADGLKMMETISQLPQAASMQMLSCNLEAVKNALHGGTQTVRLDFEPSGLDFPSQSALARPSI